jgi:hypothetical protein
VVCRQLAGLDWPGHHRHRAEGRRRRAHDCGISNDLWTSPFTEDAAAVVPTKRRAIPKSGAYLDAHGIGGGFYAMLEQESTGRPSALHVYRLSDARHWAISGLADSWPGAQVPAGSETWPVSILHLDEEEVWFTGWSEYGHQQKAIVRQRLDALGPGD